MEKAIKLCEANGLINVTTQRQLKNGTLSFKDPHTYLKTNMHTQDLPLVNTQYKLYANGAVRKTIGGSNDAGNDNQYQLNPKIIKNNKHIRIYYPNDYEKMAQIAIRVSAKSRLK